MDSKARVKKENGKIEYQTLKEHSLNVAQNMEDRLLPMNLSETSKFNGLIHDEAKTQKAMQDYYERIAAGLPVVKGSVIHSFTPVIYLLEKYHNIPLNAENYWEYMASEINSYITGSHHGLFDMVSCHGDNGFLHRLSKDKGEIEYQDSLERFYNEVVSEEDLHSHFLKSAKEYKCHIENIKKCNKSKKECFYAVGQLIRTTISGLIFADRKDAREYMTGNKEKTLLPDWNANLNCLKQNIEQMNHISEIDKVRMDIFKQCLSFASNPTGIYRLNAPTGSGKTLSVLAYAIEHARLYKKQRIFLIIPSLYITSQNALAIKNNIQNKEYVLEHHSNVVIEKDDPKAEFFNLMTETWDPPIIVTTYVQFMNACNSSNSSAIARMSALLNSVIVFDEVQTISPNQISLFTQNLNFLSEQGNSTIVLSSATQPCFDEIDTPLRFSQNADMVNLTQDQIDVFKRATVLNYTTKYGMDDNEFINFCIERINKCSSTLISCNTQKEAYNAFRALEKICDKDKIHLFHLSNNMCPAHQKDIFEKMKTDLDEVIEECRKAKQAGKKIVCVATQVMNAGVDISFESAIKIMSGLDDLIQVIGRVNRAWEYKNGGTVYLVNLKDEKLANLPEIQRAQICTQSVLVNTKYGEEIEITEELIADYYRRLYKEAADEMKYYTKIDGIKVSLVDLLSNNNSFADQESKDYAFRYPFKSVGDVFKVYPDNKISIIVPYKEGEKIIDSLRLLEKNNNNFAAIKDLLNKAKQYTVDVYEYRRDALLKNGDLESLYNGNVYVLSKAAYDENVGICINEKEVTDFIL